MFDRGDEPLPAKRAPQTARRSGAKNPKPRDYSTDEESMAEVDRILDKILVSGLDSLTEVERQVMAKYSQRNKPS